MSDPRSEAMELAAVLVSALPERVDGREAIEAMRAAGSRNWKQMEWIGFWFEGFARQALMNAAGGGAGPAYGRTTFDYRRHHVWDLKCHPHTNMKGVAVRDLILNDAEAIQRCIAEHGSVNFLVVHGTAEFDADGSFKAWHDHLKGGVSRYEEERIARRAPSRARKIAFIPERLTAYSLDAGAIKHGVENGWLLPFQEGMRNADGSPRRGKHMFRLAAVASDIYVEWDLRERHLAFHT
jgi:hypothetical protein